MDFKGITRDALFMMADNRFRNSKAYYDEHKEELKAKMTVPMRQIAGRRRIAFTRPYDEYNSH